MRRASDQHSSDAAAQEPSDDIAMAVEKKFESPSTEEAVQGVDEAQEEFDGFDGSWDYEWVSAVDAFMEAMPLTWIAVAVFTGGVAYSYIKQKRS